MFYKIKKFLIKVFNSIRVRLQAIIRNTDPFLVFYKYIYRKKIINSKPFICKKDSGIEIHMITSKKDFLDAIWCLKTFYYYSNLNPMLVIHNDGTLKDEHKKILLNHFQGAEIVERDKSNKEMNDFLKDFKNIIKFREIKNFYCAMKIFDILKYSYVDKLIMLDSDILFFKRPDEIIDHLVNNKFFFNSDIQDSYAEDVTNFLKNHQLGILPKINAGLIHISKKYYFDHLELMDDYFNETQSYTKSKIVNRHEQTLHAILLSKANASRLSEQYQISKKPIMIDTVSHHFVNDGSRELFYTKGLKMLKKKNFLENIS
jgi:hypothetical protein